MALHKQHDVKDTSKKSQIYEEEEGGPIKEFNQFWTSPTDGRRGTKNYQPPFLQKQLGRGVSRPPGSVAASEKDSHIDPHDDEDGDH